MQCERECTFFGFGFWNEHVGDLLAFLVVVLHGQSSFLISLTEEALTFFFGGAVVIFAFAFSVCLCPFLLTSGMDFEGNILATCKVINLLVPVSG